MLALKTPKPHHDGDALDVTWSRRICQSNLLVGVRKKQTLHLFQGFPHSHAAKPVRAKGTVLTIVRLCAMLGLVHHARKWAQHRAVFAEKRIKLDDASTPTIRMDGVVVRY